MKIKDGFAKREIAGSYIVVPVGQKALDFNGMITLNETGSFFWDCLTEETDAESVIEKVTAEYDVSPEKAKSDLERFIRLLGDNGIIE